nr:MAPEG family protein [Arenimonas sp. GDDSR-1]
MPKPSGWPIPFKEQCHDFNDVCRVLHAAGHPACRARHANATEYMPLALILLGSLELTGFPPYLIHVLGGTFLFSRIIHAWGVSHNAGYSKGRFWGMVLTWLPMIVMAAFAIVGSISAQIPRFQ